MDLGQKAKADSWQKFAKGKGAKKVAGFMSAGVRRESIFKVAEGGKVGVVGSGRGMTDFSKRARHEFDKADE